MNASECTLDTAQRELLRSAGLPDARIVQRIAGGFANDVLLVRSGAHRAVLRRWTRAPRTAAVEIGALAEAAADGIPVPEVLAAGNDMAVLSWVPGVRGDRVLADARQDEARQVGVLLGELARQVAARSRGAAGTIRRTGEGMTVDPWPAAGGELLRTSLADATEAPPGWREWAAGFAAELEPMTTRTERVHADFNPKNMLLVQHGDDWRVSALLDWEFTFAGPSEVDIGNLLRFEPRAQQPDAFGAGVRSGLGGLCAQRLREARVLDLLALCGFLSPLPAGRQDHPIRRAVRDLAAHQLATGQP